MDIYSMTDMAIIEEIGARLRRARLQKNLSQEEVARRVGLSRSTIVDVETGRRPTTLLTFIQILRAIEALDAIDSLLPEPGVSPLQIAKLKGRQRKRASKQQPSGEEESEW